MCESAAIDYRTQMGFAPTARCGVGVHPNATVQNTSKRVVLGSFSGFCIGCARRSRHRASLPGPRRLSASTVLEVVPMGIPQRFWPVVHSSRLIRNCR